MTTASLLPAGLLLVVASLAHPHPRAVTLPCRSAPDTASAVLGSIRGHMNNLDSTDQVALHLAAPPSPIVLVTDSTACAAAIDGYNAHVSTWDSALVATSAYVVSAGPVFLVPTVPGVAGHSKVTVALDSTFGFLTAWEHPH